MKIAIVGTGISGLSAAYLLSREGTNEVHLFESEDDLGMCSHTLTFGSVHIDSPPRSYSEDHYVHLSQMYREIGAVTQPFPWDTSFSNIGDENCFYRSAQMIIGGYRLPAFWNFIRLVRKLSLRVMIDSAYFFKSTPEEISNTMTVEEYVVQGGYSKEFIDGILLPILSMAFTCSYEACLEYPIAIVLQYFANSNSLNQRITVDGSRAVAKLLSQHVHTIHLSTKVTGVYRSLEVSKGTRLTYSRNEVSYEDYFDHVVIASQAKSALYFLKNPTDEEINVLSSINHETTDVIVHRDAKLMPPNANEWAFLNFIMAKDVVKDDSPNTTTAEPIRRLNAMCTMWITRFENKATEAGTLYQTWNPIIPVDPTKVIKQISFVRPLFNKHSYSLIQQLRKMQGNGNIWYCGTYTCFQVPLQESGVVSALEIAKQLGCSIEWHIPELDANDISLNNSLKQSDGYLARVTSQKSLLVLSVGIPVVLSASLFLRKVLN